ncbi:MAG TPA: arylamine N-acetyltransferase [Pyrinomonadaceae bacterium]|nr:arylamine N-acetyltransferase [Pyrinomonadaceae bacterium]
MDINTYLNRINYHGSREPIAETLRELQVAHLRAVPFENLSIHSAEPIVLDDESLFEKVVGRRRGGFCYELNGLFAALLRALGFKVEMLSAGVANSEGVVGPDFDHMALMVVLEQRWLADVGFGDSFREPLLLDERGIQTQGDRNYKIVAEGEYLTLMQREKVGDWIPQYRFTLQPHVYADYAEMCNYHQTSPDSHFTKAPLCSLATIDGRITLSGGRLITTTGSGEKHEVTVSGEAEFAKLLREHFGIEMD